MIGFVILAHDDPAALRRLVLRLEGAPIVAHLDATVDLASFDSVARLASVDGFQYASRRVAVNWGGYSVVTATINALRESFPLVGASDQLVFLSGRCYPVKPITSFKNYLGDASWSVHARAYPVDHLGGWHSNRYRVRHGFDRSARLGPPRSVRRRLGRRLITGYANTIHGPVETPLQVMSGSQWMAMPRECAEEAIEALSGPDYRFFQDAFAPDEMAIQTFVHNSRWRALTEFGPEMPDHEKVSAIPNFHLLDPEMTGQIDRVRALAPGARDFFVRKVDSARDSLLLEEIDVRCHREQRAA